MKKKLLLLLALFCITREINAQCSVTYPVANDCVQYGDVISYFELNGIPATGNAACSPNGYQMFPAPVWNLQPGMTYTFYSTLGIGTDDEGIAIWIDLNNDNDYAPSEMLFASAVPAPTQSGSFTIPLNATTGTNLHMRVMGAYNWVFSNTDACIDFVNTWGETEDHFVYITCPSTTLVPVAVSNTLVCSGGTVALTASGYVNYSWTGGVFNGAPFIANATQNYTVTASSPSSAACPSVIVTTVKTVSVTTVPLVVNATSSSASVCAGSNSTLTASGATSYTWMPGGLTNTVVTVNPTAPVSYTLTGANASGCPGTAVLPINVQPVPTLTIAASNTLLCTGDQVNLTANGNAISYTWSPGGSNAPSIVSNPTGTSVFSVTVSNAIGCKSSAMKVIAVNQNPFLNINVSDLIVCKNGTATITVSGANASYSWSTGSSGSSSTLAVSPSSTTVYSVIGTNNNTCHSTATVEIAVYEPTIAVSNNTAICIGANTNINASGADSYLWLNNSSSAANINVSPTATTIYTVTGVVTDNGLSCNAENTVEVTVNALPDITATAANATVCAGKSTTLTADGAGANGTYVWSLALGNTAAITVAPIAAQSYSVTGTDANGCKKMASVSVAISPCVGIEALSVNTIDLMIYPNPSNGEFTISSHEKIKLNIVNELGQLIKVITLTTTTPEAKINNLENGVYFITGKNENGSVNQKIVVAK